MSAPTTSIVSTTSAPNGGTNIQYTADYSGYEITKWVLAPEGTTNAAAVAADAATWAAYIDTI